MSAAPGSKAEDVAFSSRPIIVEASQTIGHARIILGDPCTLFREGLVHVLEQGRFIVIGSGNTVASAMGRIPLEEQPDILLCCVRSGEQPEEWLMELLAARARFVGLRSVLLGDLTDDKFLSRASELEVDAVLSQNISGEVLRGSLRLVMLGQRIFPAPPIYAAARGFGLRASEALPIPETAPVQEAAPVTPIPTLSEREDQILRFLASGTRNKLIAHDLGITEATVKFHIRALLRKLGATNRTQAAILGMRSGIPRESDRS